MNKPVASKRWLITGASRGLGLAMAISALEAGHKVIACARNPTTAAAAHPEIDSLGGSWLKLDVTSRDTEHIVQKAVQDYGFIDVVVNNAGFYQAGPMENFSEEEMYDAMDTLFFGAIRVLNGVLPSMRARRTGVILGIGSIYGFYGAMAGSTLYSCPKAALHMLHSVLAEDLHSFNIRVHTVVAGTYRTEILTQSKVPAKGISQEYLAGRFAQVAAKSMEFVQSSDHMIGDPKKLGERVVEIVDGTGLGKGLEANQFVLFGSDAVTLSTKWVEVVAADIEATKEFAQSTDFGDTDSLGAATVLHL